jgi:glutaredoxin
MKSKFGIVALLLCMLAGNAIAQPIYRWVDANGRVHYTAEKPPTGIESTPVQARINSYSGAPLVSGQAPAAAPAGVRAPVTMYATDWCPYCRKAREFLARNGVPYVELDIEKSAAAKAEYHRLGARGVPVIVVGAQRMNGFSEARLAQMLKSAGY